MGKNTRTIIILILMILVVSCEVNINPDINLVIEPQDVLDFGYVQKYSKSVLGLSISNTGKKSIALTNTGIEFYDSSTTYFEFTITAGKISQDVILTQSENHEIEIAFTPKTNGDKVANLVIQYVVGEEITTIRYKIMGSSYSGYIQLNPPLLSYSHAYVSEKKIEQVTITNTDTKSLTIKSVKLTNYDSNTDISEFYISNGWYGSEVTLAKGQTIRIEITFKPIRLGTKRVVFVVNIKESSFKFNSTLVGTCCEQLEFISPTKLPDAIRNTPYTFDFICAGGDGNYSLSVPNSNLPDGLTISSTTLKGTPKVNGTMGFSIVLTDGSGHSTYKTFTLHIQYAKLYRDTADVDPVYNFDKNIDNGLYVINLIAEGEVSLTINSIEITGTGFNSGEASIITQPTLPFSMNDGDRTQIVIKVESLMDAGRQIKLTVKHTGYNSPFEQEFQWHVAQPDKSIYLICGSGSMSSAFNGGFPVYDANGNIIRYPNRFQAARSLMMEKIQDLPSTCSFEIIYFETNVNTCFGTMTNATNTAKSTALTWLFSKGTKGCDNSYDALKAAYNNYGQVDLVEYYANGYPNTALSLGCGACNCSWIGSRIIQDTRTWMQQQITWNQYHKLRVIQIGGSPYSFMVQLGALPNADFILK